jgi:putative membrane protein (TIGR04086 family)
LLDLLDRRAVIGGALACLLLTGPAAIVLAVIDRSSNGDESNWVLAVLILVVGGFLLGGARAGRSALRAPFVNGAAATLLVFVVVQGIAAVVNAFDGDDINAVAVVFNALLAASIGTVGAWFGIRWAARNA